VRKDYRNPALPDGFEKPHTRFDEERQQTFLAEYAKTGRMMHSAATAGVCDETVRGCAKRDEAFALSFDAAKEVFKELLEVEAYTRGVVGWEEPVVQKGAVVYFRCATCKRKPDLMYECNACDGTGDGDMVMTRRKSDRVFELILKRQIPEYRDKFEMNVTAQGGVLAVPIGPTTDAEWEDVYSGQQQENNYERALPQPDAPLAPEPEPEPERPPKPKPTRQVVIKR
jgi:hypothetical protein